MCAILILQNSPIEGKVHRNLILLPVKVAQPTVITITRTLHRSPAIKKYRFYSNATSI